MRHSLVLSAVLSLACAPVFAGSLNFTGNYSQDFNLLPRENVDNPANAVVSVQTSRGPHDLSVGFVVPGFDGWFGSNPAGSSSNTEFKSHNGSLAGGDGRGVLSLGLNGDSDRSLGALSTSNQVNTFGLVLLNSTNATIDSLNVSFTGEQWRRGNILSTSEAVNSLRFTFATFATDPGSAAIADLQSPPAPGATTFAVSDALTFNSPNRQDSPLELAINGNEPQNRVSRSATLDSLGWQAGQFLVLRWSARDISGQDDGLSIDDLVLSTGTNPPEFTKGDFGGSESPDGSFNSPDGQFNELDVEGFLLALNDRPAFLLLNGGIEASLDARGDFGGAESTDGSFNTPDGGFNELDVEGFLLALNDPSAYAAIQPSGRVTVIPEPMAIGLLTPAILALGRARRR